MGTVLLYNDEVASSSVWTKLLFILANQVELFFTSLVLTDDSGHSEEQLESRDKNHVEGYRQTKHNKFDLGDIEISPKEVCSSK